MRSSRAVSNSKSLSAPIGGLNAHDSLALMPPTDAVKLTNFFPSPTSVDLRSGYVRWATGLPANVESLMGYVSATQTKIFAASGTAFYDVTSQAAIGAAVQTGLTNARWQHQNYGTTGGQFLYCVNGTDDPRLYNGTAWQSVNAVSAPISITGITTSKFIAVTEYRSRLFFIETNSFNVWYLPVNSLGGAAASLDLTPFYKLGGYLMAMATWAVDSAGSINEYIAFISSEGEIVVYLGTDPSVAGNFVIQAKFRIGKPLGRRCVEKVGSDVILIGADGFFPLSKALLTDRAQLNDQISNKIVNLVTADAQKYANNFGWDIILYPTGSKVIINVPQVAGKVQYQYVMNTITGAWCKFTGWNSNCWLVIGNDLYFGGNAGTAPNTGYTAKADYGYADDGGYIFGEVQTAFNYFDAPGRLKRMTMVRPVFMASGVISAAINMDMDYADNYPSAAPSFSSTAGTAWNVGAWNTFPWGSAPAIQKNWQGVNGIGYAGALHMRIANNASPVQWQSIDYVFETGGIL